MVTSCGCFKFGFIPLLKKIIFTLSSCLSIIGIEDLIIDKVTCCGFFKYAFIALFKKIMFIIKLRLYLSI